MSEGGPKAKGKRRSKLDTYKFGTSKEAADAIRADAACWPPQVISTPFPAPSHVIAGVDYAPGSQIWDRDAPPPVAESGNVRISRNQRKRGGAESNGVSLSPADRIETEAHYRIETSLPVPGANHYPLIDNDDPAARLFRFTAASRYAAPEINHIPGGPDAHVTAEAVLANLDGLTVLSDGEVAPEGWTRAAYEAALDPENTEVDADSLTTPLLIQDRALRYASGGFNRYVSESDPFLIDYSDNEYRADLTLSYERGWPEFPYVCKTHPNAYFNDVEAHIKSLHPIWGLFGNDTLQRGWNAFAQDRVGLRKPAMYCRPKGAMRGHAEPFYLAPLEKIKLPAYSLIPLAWTLYSPHSNIAMLMGARNGNTFALDIDVTDREMIGRIVRIIEREVGLSPFIRVGAAPKIALIYRMAAGETIPSRNHVFTGDRGAIEVLGQSKSLTIYGVHHRMRHCFQWVGSATPAEHGPEHAPVLSASDLSYLLSCIEEEVAPFTKRESGEGWLPSSEGGQKRAASGEWVVGNNGLVVDGRSRYVAKMTWDVVRQCWGNVVEAKGENADSLAQVAAAIRRRIITLLVETMVCEDRWQADRLESIIAPDVDSLIDGRMVAYMETRVVDAPVDLSDDAQAQVSAALQPKAGIQGAADESSADFSRVAFRNVVVARRSMIAERASATGSISTFNMRRGQKIGLLSACSGAAARSWRAKKLSFILNGESRETAEDVAEREAFEALEEERKKWLPDDDGRRCLDPVSRISAAILKGQILQEGRVTVHEGSHPIPMPRARQAEDISARMAQVVDLVAEAIYEPVEPDAVRDVLLVDAMTGAGKTSRIIERIVRDPRTVQNRDYVDAKGKLQNGRCPVVIAMPTYKNIEEAMSRARLCGISADLCDADFVDEIVRLEIAGRAEAIRRLPEFRQVVLRTGRDPSLPPLDIQVYSGRKRAGCPFVSAINTLGEAGQGGDRMCAVEKTSRTGGKLRDENGDVVMQYCPRYSECGYIAQKERVKTAHVVFIPHSFLSEGRLPDALASARVLIVDEQIHPQFIKTAFLRFEDFQIEADVFTSWRLPDVPPATGDDDAAREQAERRKKTLKHNQEMEELRAILPLRTWLLSRVYRALRERKDPARSLIDLREAFDLGAWRETGDIISDASIYSAEDMARITEGLKDAFPCVEQHVRLLAPIVQRNDDRPGEESASLLPATAKDCGPEVVGVHEALAKLGGLLQAIARQDTRITPAKSRDSGPQIPDAVRNKLSQPGVRNARIEATMWAAISERIETLLRYERVTTEPTSRQAAYMREILDMKETAEDDPFIQAMLKVNLALEVERDLGPGREPHSHDSRFQFVSRREFKSGRTLDTMRFSWRDQPGWAKTPVVLLDASASVSVLEKIFQGRRVVVHRVVEDVGAALNMHIVAVTGTEGLSFSGTSLVAGGGASLSKLTAAAINLSSVRDAVSAICGAHANTRVVLGAVKKVRQALMTGWSAPPMLDTCHYGAIRGIDAYKAHGALISLGRMELPIEDIDAVAGALSWDSETYEPPFNIHGDGTEDGTPGRPLYQPEVSRSVRMRDGGRADFATPEMPGFWAKTVQEQIREEEINQLIGRTRPVYRDADRRPVCYIMSNTIPKHLILDKVVSICDISGVIEAKAENAASTLPLGQEMSAGVGGLAQVYADRSHMTALLQNAWADPSGAFLAPGHIVKTQPGLIPGITDSQSAMYRVMAAHGFYSMGEWAIGLEGKEVFGVPPVSAAGMADGWIGATYETEDGPQGVWTPSIIWESREVAIRALFERISIMGGYAPRLMMCPTPDSCHIPTLDGVDHKIQTGCEPADAMSLAAISEGDRAAALAASRKARRPMLLEFRKAIEALTTLEFQQTVGVATVTSTAFQHASEGYRIMPLLASILEGRQPVMSGKSGKQAAEARESAMTRVLTGRQIAALLSVWHTMGEDAHAIRGLTDMIKAKANYAAIMAEDSISAFEGKKNVTQTEAVTETAAGPTEDAKDGEAALNETPAPRQSREVRNIGPARILSKRPQQWGVGVYRPIFDLKKRRPQVPA